MNEHCGIAILAKAPLAGYAKTRLAPALGAAGAAALAERLLEHAAAQAVAARLGPVVVWAAPDASHAAFARLRQRHGLALAVQGEGDLGARMARVFEQTLAAGTARLLLMGTDAPALDAATLRRAAAALDDHDAVFVPALDGGYALVGLRAWDGRGLRLFTGMTWSTPQVMAQTRARLAAAGLSHAELPAVADIDEPADLAHLPADFGAGAAGTMPDCSPCPSAMPDVPVNPPEPAAPPAQETAPETAPGTAGAPGSADPAAVDPSRAAEDTAPAAAGEPVVAAGPASEPAAEGATEPAGEAVAGPVAGPAMEPAVEPVAEPAIEPAAVPDEAPADGASAATPVPQASAPADGAASATEVPAAAPAPAAADAPAAPAAADLSPAACAARLAELFPALFGAGRALPIKLRIQADIQQRAPGQFSRKSLSTFLHRHTTSTAYLKALAHAPQRLDLDGAPAGEIEDVHRQAAAAELERRRGLFEARRAAERAAANETRRVAEAAARQQHVAEDQARRDRAALLRAYESSTLTRTNFCVLKGIAEADLDGQLHQAWLEREQRAQDVRPPVDRGPAPREARPPDARQDTRRGGGREARPTERPDRRPDEGSKDRTGDRPGNRADGPRRGAPGAKPPR